MQAFIILGLVVSGKLQILLSMYTYHIYDDKVDTCNGVDFLWCFIVLTMYDVILVIEIN